ncbi:MAG: deoxyhypusine synthase [Nitrospirae bacterium RIFCSPLOWO2_02_42_7]|nr:MAG: deoxyhypusine synthase [Nitrospirae bacterium RIFCSPLOWO2_02_42_7]
MTRSKLLKHPTIPFEIREDSTVADVLTAMSHTAFQARNLSTALDVWGSMLKGRTMIFFGLAGAMVPAGMRNVIVYLIQNRLIDCLVSTGANLFHDIHETVGRYHYQGSQFADDDLLQKEGIDRIYDVFASEPEFRSLDDYIMAFAETLDLNRSYTTREFLFLLGQKLSKETDRDGIVTSAYKAGVPIYCPAIGDSSIGIGLAARTKGKKFMFDIVADVQETAILTLKAAETGVIYIGGGTPKNFIQQMEVTASLWHKDAPGHEYAIQITTDAPHWGGLSGCTFDEAKSWGKIKKSAKMATVHCDSTIALPIIVTAVAQKYKDTIRKRAKPDLLKILAKTRMEDLKRVLDFSPVVC